jgi:hypothetical protein
VTSEGAREEQGPEQWPGVDVAFEFVLPSYGWALSRLEAIDGRLQALQAFSATVVVAAPVVARSLDAEIDFLSPWFLSAILAFVLIVAIGGVARVLGTVRIASPEQLYEGWLEYEPWEFKKNAVYWAGEHSRANTRVIRRKGIAAAALTAILIAEVGLLAVWVAAS